ncbi:MAG: hypothetical protein Q8S13_12525, partial [Dehalococcoidia bacterium]|nr:hypothetical protein [Dehalococcoidia bacterium]
MNVSGQWDGLQLRLALPDDVPQMSHAGEADTALTPPSSPPRAIREHNRERGKGEDGGGGEGVGEHLFVPHQRVDLERGEPGDETPPAHVDAVVVAVSERGVVAALDLGAERVIGAPLAADVAQNFVDDFDGAEFGAEADHLPDLPRVPAPHLDDARTPRRAEHGVEERGDSDGDEEVGEGGAHLRLAPQHVHAPHPARAR